MCTLPHLTLYLGAGDLNQVLMLMRQELYRLNHLPSHSSLFLPTFVFPSPPRARPRLSSMCWKYLLKYTSPLRMGSHVFCMFYNFYSSCSAMLTLGLLHIANWDLFCGAPTPLVPALGRWRQGYYCRFGVNLSCHSKFQGSSSQKMRPCVHLPQLPLLYNVYSYPCHPPPNSPVIDWHKCLSHFKL